MTFEVIPGKLMDSGIYTFARSVAYQITNVYAVSMAGVFMGVDFHARDPDPDFPALDGVPRLRAGAFPAPEHRESLLGSEFGLSGVGARHQRVCTACESSAPSGVVMTSAMEYLLNEPWLLGLVLAICLAVAIELGRRTSDYTHIQEDTNRKDQTIAIRDGLFFLLSLLLGFTLSLAVPRFNERRARLVEEAVSIGTTYLRASTLPQPYRDSARDLLRHYVDTRLDLDDAGNSAARFKDATNRSKHIQAQLWAGAVAVA